MASEVMKMAAAAMESSGIISSSDLANDEVFGNAASNRSSIENAAQRSEGDLSPFEKLHVLRLHDKEEGYPQLAAFLASDSNFAMYWNPSHLRSRLLLQKQAKLTALKKRLEAIDAEDAKEDAYILQSRAYDNTREEADQRRDKLLDELDVELKAYDDLLIRERTIRSFERPSSRNYLSVIRFLDEERPLDPPEEEPFLNYREIVSLAAGQDNTWLEGWIEDLLLHVPRRWAQKIFTEPEMRSRHSKERPVYFAQERISLASKAITILVSLTIAMIPTLLLFLLRLSHAAKIVIMLCAVILFSGALAVCSRSKHQDIFIATAAILLKLLTRTARSWLLFSVKGHPINQRKIIHIITILRLNPFLGCLVALKGLLL